MITEIEIAVIIRLLAATCCGGLIGFERKLKGQFAGLKTFSLVCMGSAMVMTTNEYIYSNLSLGNGDPTRMAAQVISGIGFLGAGTIIVTNHSQIIGLSTAAALWVTASIGIAIGSGFYFCGITGVAILFVSSRIHRLLDKWIIAYSKIMRIYVIFKDENFMIHLAKYCNDNNIKILTVSRESKSAWFENSYCAIVELKCNKRLRHEQIINNIQTIEGLLYVEEEDI